MPRTGVGSLAVLSYVTSSDGVKIACETSGSGPPLVLLHGAGSARWSFDGLRPLMEDRFTVVAADRRGRGDSGDAATYELQRDLADLGVVLTRTGSGAIVFGHSYGGMIAAALAPSLDGMRALALYEPPTGGVLTDPGWTDRIERLIRSGRREEMLAEYLQVVGGYAPAEVEAMRGTEPWHARLAVTPTVPREMRAEYHHALPTAALARLDLPTLLLLGTESPEWARRSTKSYAAAIPGAQVRSLEGQGHGALAAAPELVARELSAFLARAV